MQRRAMSSLVDWKISPRRKPLIITGARQVGKTWLMKEFGKKHFEKVAYITFDNNPRMPAVFDGSLSPERLVPIMQVEAGTRIDEQTLVILDEIQEVPRALQSLKYFCEETPQLAVVAAGSSLGLALKRRRKTKKGGDEKDSSRASFPVGKVNFLDLYPLSFDEFLRAVGKELLADLVEQLDWDALSAFHSELVDLVRTYLYVGGMPEAVATYADSKDLFSVRDVHTELLRSYDADFNKHAGNVLAERIRLVWKSVPANLAKENRKYMFSRIKASARAREFEDALQWLVDSSLVHRVACVNEPSVPLSSHEDGDAFKVFCHDVGLLGAMNNVDARMLLEGDALFCSYKGSLAEQFVLQELLASGQAGSAHYFKNESTRTEIDFVVDGNKLDPDTVPIEVKYGTNLKAKSLTAYVKKHGPDRALRVSAAAHAVDGSIEDVPFYAFGSYMRSNITGAV